MSPQKAVDEVVNSKLCGRGGAGFPTGQKWEVVAKNSTKKKAMFKKILEVNFIKYFF